MEEKPPEIGTKTGCRSESIEVCRQALEAALLGRTPPSIEAPLVGRILKDYRLDLKGIHGPAHWLRVMEYGRLLAAGNGADLQVVSLFALLHDARRLSDRKDPGHGPRAAAYVRRLAGEGRLDVSTSQLELLCRACERHTTGVAHPDLTVRTCWDADRLDLHRFGWKIDPAKLNTPEAVEFVSRPEPPFLETFLNR